MTNTPEQIALFKWIENGTGHGLLNSVAGSGKTTSIIQSLNYIDDTLPVTVCSFTKLVAGELRKRVEAEKFTNVDSTTLNSLGWKLCKANVRGVVLDPFKSQNILRYHLSQGSLDREMQDKVHSAMRSVIVRMVSLLKSYVVRKDLGEWIDKIIKLHDIELPEGSSDEVKYGRQHFKKLVGLTYATSIEFKQECDFDDQKFQPVYHGWKGKAPAFIVVDECQDVNVCDIQLVKLMMNDSTRALWVGDPRQSIYGFRGSLPDACEQIKARFDCQEMGLTCNWRCPDKVLALAQKTVPQICGPVPNPRGEGVVEDVETKAFVKSARVGDFVISRTTAPLVKRCLQLLQMGTPAMVKGKDLSRTLIELMDKIHARLQKAGFKTQTHDVAYHTEFIKELSLYKSEEVFKLEKAGREEFAVQISDRCEALEVFCLQANSTAAVVAKIESLFADEVDESKVVLFLTGHKSKGLENDRVFFLRPDMCPHPKAVSKTAQIQEENLRYVIVTRARKELYMVLKEADEK